MNHPKDKDAKQVVRVLGCIKRSVVSRAQDIEDPVCSELAVSQRED